MPPFDRVAAMRFMPISLVRCLKRASSLKRAVAAGLIAALILPSLTAAGAVGFAGKGVGATVRIVVCSAAGERLVVVDLPTNPWNGAGHATGGSPTPDESSAGGAAHCLYCASPGAGIVPSPAQLNGAAFLDDTAPVVTPPQGVARSAACDLRPPARAPPQI